jgi:small subunit ribosomal protein S8e
MAISQLRSRRNVTGSRYVNSRKKKKYELGRTPVLTKLGKKVIKQVRTPGNNKKVKLLNEEFISLVGKDKKATKVKITSVIENPANRHYVRRNILTKGTIVETEKGKARITSRPGQTGSLAGVLV